MRASAALAAILITGMALGQPRHSAKDNTQTEQPAPPVGEKPPVVSKLPADPQSDKPAKPKPPAPAPKPTDGPSCRLGKADYAHLMSVKARTLAACDNTDTFAKVQVCAAADQEWEAEFDRLCGPGSPGAGAPEQPAPAPSPSSEPTPVPAPAPTAEPQQKKDDKPAPAKPPANTGGTATAPKCPTADDPVATSPAMIVEKFLDQVLMPLLMPGMYGAATPVQPRLTPEHIVWAIAHAMEESIKVGTNPFNRQYDNQKQAADNGDTCKPASRKEYLSPTDLGIREDGWPDQSEKGLWLKTVGVCVPAYPDSATALNRYLQYLSTHNKASHAALIDDDGSLSAYLGGLNGYGTHPNYKNDPGGGTTSLTKLSAKFNPEYKRIASYLEKRAQLYKAVEACRPGADLSDELKIVERARASAAAAAAATQVAADAMKKKGKP